LPAVEAELVRSWVSLPYITNLPHALNFDISMPRKTVKSVNIVDPTAELSDIELVTDPTIATGKDCALLSPAFLSALEAKDIERLRRLTEFKDLTAARLNGNAETLKRCLLAYLRALGEEGPKIVDPAIDGLEAQVRVKRRLSDGAEIAGVLLIITNPVLGSLLTICALFLRATKDTEEKLCKHQRAALIELQSQRSGSLLDFCHDDRNRAVP
jgi:hypothetical protein